MLILCGSFIGFMEKEVLGKQSPLFGRRTAQIFLKPFGYQEATDFHPGYSLTNQVKAYFLFGGVPLYHQYFSQNNSIDGNIESKILNPYAPLFQEPDFLLREELREIENYYAILMAIASGEKMHAQISKKTGIENRALSYYLKQLMELGYLEKKYPLFENKPSVKKVRYVLQDPFLRFWFRFVYPNTSHLQQMGSSKTMQSRIIPELDSYFGLCFEKLCREALPFLYQKEGVSTSFRVGEYWDQKTQIDVVGFREDGWTDLGECKWGSVASTKIIEQEIVRKAEKYPNTRNATLGLRIFCRKRPQRKGDKELNIEWYGLDDLFES